MNLRSFIERPVLSGVISITIVLLGLIGLFSLPIEQYPDIAPPTVMVMATYYGASAETLEKAVVAPLEESINGVENMTYMTSTMSNAGSATLMIYFKQGTDPDMAAVNVQNRVKMVEGRLPSEVTQVGVTVVKRQTSMLQVLNINSPHDTYDENFLANYFNINLKPEISRIQGVGDIVVLGATYGMRVWLHPDVMAQYGLTPADIRGVIGEQNLEASTGSLGENSDETFQYAMKYTGRLLTPEQFQNIVIKCLPDGSILRLKDIATVELGREEYGYEGELDGHPGCGIMIFQVAGSNATEINKQIDAYVAKASKDLPEDVEIVQMTSTDDFLYASIKEVIKTLLETVLLVILVVYFFLQDIRASLIPLVGIVVSLVGTFLFMKLAGFSINLLTLFALVLVIGTVVDDSIVVVEAVQARFDVGYKSSYMATQDAMKGISNAVITSSLVFMAVFIPVSFMGGTSGTFYREFGLTMAVAVGISAVNALTLSPALCALLLSPYFDDEGKEKNNFAARFRHWFNSWFQAMVERYKNGVVFMVKHRWIVWSLLVVASVGLLYLMSTTKSSLVPQEDQGVIMVDIKTQSGFSVAQTAKIVREIRSRLDGTKGEPLPKLYHIQMTAGYGLIGGQGSSNGMMIIRLQDWSERTGRDESVDAVIKQIYARTADIKGVQLIAFAPAMIPGYGTGNGVELYLQDENAQGFDRFMPIMGQYLGALNQRPEVKMAYSSFAVDYPQYQVSVDAAQCKKAGISPSSVLATMGGYFGSNYVSDINRFNKVYRVMIQADPRYRLDERSISQCYVRMNNGQMAPLSQFVSMKRVYGAETIRRFNMFPAIPVTVMPAEGYSSGEAIKASQEVAEQTLPRGYSYDFGGISREEANQTSSQTGIIFGICIIFIYLILSALYESFLIPFAVILSVPCGLFGSFLFAKCFGMENNIYLQVGLIMLIGLLSKTAILLTEYAVERRRAGMNLTSAAVEAAKARLRPILMTALTMIVGLFPLVVAHGVGANGNRSLGVGTVGGMTIGTLALLFLVPALFIAFEKLQEKLTPIQTEDSHDWQIQEEAKEAQADKAKYLKGKEEKNNG